MALFRMSNELKARIVSSFVMAVVAIAALWSSIWTFTILILVLAMAVCWEWGRAVRGKNLDAGHAVHSATMFAVAMAAAANNYATALCLLLIGALAVALVSDRKHWIFSIAGVFYIGLPATALIWLRSDDTYGIHAVLFILFVVAAHDTFAMVVGRMIGGVRLWPAISPHKTWSGVCGGLAASCLAGALFALAFEYNGILWLIGLGLAIGVAGLAGDLLESAFKRYHGLKHASMLIPGHGGVMDRLDGIIVAAITAALIAGVLDHKAPAKVLMLGL